MIKTGYTVTFYILRRKIIFFFQLSIINLKQLSSVVYFAEKGSHIIVHNNKKTLRRVGSRTIYLEDAVFVPLFN